MLSAPSQTDNTDILRSIVAQVMRIDDTTLGEPDKFFVRFRGRLVIDSVEAYARVAERFHPLGYTPLFRKDGEADAVLAVSGVDTPRPSRAWVSWLLLVLTFFSVLFVGGQYGYEGPVPTTVSDWIALIVSGWPFVVSLLGILMAHEFGHYFAARYHKIAVTLPNFIPLPVGPFGTMGAFIQLKARPTNRRVLLDIGVAGPLAGFAVAVPVLIYGLLTSPVQPIPAVVPPEGLGIEGNSILYVLAKLAVFGRLLPEPASYGNLPPLLYMLRYYLLGIPAPLASMDVMLNQVAWAGWIGLFVTGLNLIPAGQLDGGHAFYVLFGQKRARQLLPFILVALVGLGFFWPTWFFWAALIFFFGRVYAEPLDQITQLDTKRKVLAALVLVIFILVFMPIPLSGILPPVAR